MKLSWVFWALALTYVGIIFAAGWVAVDSLRPKRRADMRAASEADGRWREPIYVYTVYCSLMVILWLVQQILAFIYPEADPFRSTFTMVAVTWSMVGIFVMFIYLLRVVFIEKPTEEPQESSVSELPQPAPEPQPASTTQATPTTQPASEPQATPAPQDATLPSRRDRKRRK
ncbi:MAG: hypothetical protein FWG78_04630 [Coriobacteriia bacterium]|nr:hypothetical protein [Coriobacteriia bacterium]